MSEERELYEYWNAHYLAAARTAFPEITGRHKLAVGWKLTNLDGTTHGGYYWPLVNGDHDLPVLHQADNWKPTNLESCPSQPGDGLCLIPQGQPVREAMSGGCRFTSAIGHVLVYPTGLSLGSLDKKRAPWVIDVDCFKPAEALAMLAKFTKGADLSGAYLHGAYLSGANLSGANLSGAYLPGAYLHGATYSQGTLWPVGFDFKVATA